MLTLIIKKQWYDMILSGKKKEEYREIKPYYISRFVKCLGFPNSEKYIVMKLLREKETIKPIYIVFRNGYSFDCPSFVAKCMLSVGTGKEEWGAEKGNHYFILHILEILNVRRRFERYYDERS